jgi:hypothetical protein
MRILVMIRRMVVLPLSQEVLLLWIELCYSITGHSRSRDTQEVAENRMCNFHRSWVNISVFNITNNSVCEIRRVCENRHIYSVYFGVPVSLYFALGEGTGPLRLVDLRPRQDFRA